MTDTPKQIWIDAAYDTLTSQGVEAVKVMELAKKLSVTRTAFYWHFKSREALLEEMIQMWEDKNTGNLVRQTEAYAENIAEAVYNVFDCWITPELFDSRLDLAIRNWARIDAALLKRIELADKRRIAAIKAMFERHGYSPVQAETRAMTIQYTQVGYIAMEVSETVEFRISRMPEYIEIFTGRPVEQSAIDRFNARHRVSQNA